MKEKFYLIVSFAHSMDKYHTSKQINHFICSTFFTREFHIENLKNVSNNTEILNIMIIRSDFLSLKCSEIESKLNVFEINSGLFFDVFRKTDKIYEAMTVYEKILLNSNNLITKGLDSTIFIFENISWSSLQSIFKEGQIDISGGSISLRHSVSTVHYNLLSFLISMGYTKKDIIQSIKFFKKKQTILSNNEILALEETDKEKLLNLLFNYMTEDVDFFKERSSNYSKIISDLEKKISNLNLEIKARNVSPEDIAKFSEMYETTEKQIGKYLSAKSELDYEIFRLINLYNDLEKEDSKDIRSYYLKRYHNRTVNAAREKYGNLINLNFKLPSRKFSSYVRPNSDIYNNFANNPFKSSLQKRNISISSSITSQKLLELLYSSDNKEEVQIKIENYLFSQQNSFILDNISKTPIDYSILSPNVNKTIIDSKENLRKLYKKSLHRVPTEDKFNLILSRVDFEFIANILFGRLLTIISYNGRANKFTFMTEVSYDLGTELINRYNYFQYIDSNLEYDSFSLFKEENSDKVILEDDATKIVKLGSILLGWLIELRLISKKVEVLDNREKRNILIVGDKIKEFILPQKNKVGLINLPKKLPMIVPPKEYRKIEGKISLGGYLLNDKLYTEELLIENSMLVNKSEISTENIILEMVNNINSVSFKINGEVLDFIFKYHKDYNLIIDPEFKHPLTLEKKLTISEKKELESFTSKQTLEFEILKLAQIFRNISNIYFPVRLDYRGRMYCTTDYLNYQGIELAKALLEFSNGEVVYLNDELSINYLKIFGANCFGNKLDKESFSDRINWIDNNTDNIINFKNGELISKAENKLLFISFCFEYNKYINALNNKSLYFYSHLPVQLDASCNGFQHLSLLLKDSTIAKQVNLSKSSWKDKPDDFYSFLSLKIKEYLEFELNSNKNLSDKELESYQRLINLEFHKHRTLVKKTIMTIPYSATIFSNILNMKEEFTFDSEKGHYLFNKDNNIIFKEIDFYVICRSLYICLYREFPKLEALFLYFKQIGSISNKLGISVPWILPSGLIVKQKFYGSKKIKLKPFIYTKDLLNLNVLDKNSNNNLKQIRALMPNIVHSLDGASLSLLIHKFFKLSKSQNFYAVHDCFAATCNNVHLISELLKLIYFDIYCNNSFLIKFDENFKNSIINQFGINSFVEKNKIQIINTEEKEKILELNYPDVNQVFKPEMINFKDSSYTIS